MNDAEPVGRRRQLQEYIYDMDETQARDGSYKSIRYDIGFWRPKLN